MGVLLELCEQPNQSGADGSAPRERILRNLMRKAALPPYEHRDRTTLVLLRQQPIVHKVGVDHHGYRRCPKQERGCGQAVISQPRDYTVDVLHDFLSKHHGTHVFGFQAQLYCAFDPSRMAVLHSQLTTICATTYYGLYGLDRAIDVTL